MNGEPEILEALEIAFRLIARVEDDHASACVIPDSVWDLISFLNWTGDTAWN